MAKTPLVLPVQGVRIQPRVEERACSATRPKKNVMKQILTPGCWKTVTSSAESPLIPQAESDASTTFPEPPGHILLLSCCPLPLGLFTPTHPSSLISKGHLYQEAFPGDLHNPERQFSLCKCGLLVQSPQLPSRCSRILVSISHPGETSSDADPQLQPQRV